MVDESWFIPLRFEPGDALARAQSAFRQGEEGAAGRELGKAEAWLKYAAAHTEPQTGRSLESAAKALESLAIDIEKGNVRSARNLDDAIAKASHALAQWHFFNAREELGRDEVNLAAANLQAAAHHLHLAADSSRYQYGPEVVVVFDFIDKRGKVVGEGVEIERNQLTDDLNVLETEITKLGESLKKSSS